MTDEDLNRDFLIAKALGARYLGCPPGLPRIQRMARAAETHNFRIYVHNEDELEDYMLAAMAVSPIVRINFDVGNYTAAGGANHVAFIEEHHDRISHLHLKDTKRNGEMTLFGQGDTPVKEILWLLRDKQYDIGVFIENEIGLHEHFLKGEPGPPTIPNVRQRSRLHKSGSDTDLIGAFTLMSQSIHSRIPPRVRIYNGHRKLGPVAPALSRPIRKAIVDRFAILPILACIFALMVAPLFIFFTDHQALVLAAQAAVARPETRVFWPIMAAISIILTLQNRSRLTLPPHLVCLVAYLTFAGASVLWALSPYHSFVRYLQQVMIVTTIVLPVTLAARTADIMRALFLVEFALILIVLRTCLRYAEWLPRARAR